MNKYYEWQQHDYHERGKHAYTYYAIVIPWKNNKVLQLEFDDDGSFNIDTYDDDDSNLRIKPLSNKLKNRFNQIIHNNNEIKEEVFHFIFVNSV